MKKSKRQEIIREILDRTQLKSTNQRCAVLDVLIHTGAPLSIEDIHKKVSVEVNKTTIYRMLHIFVKKGVVTHTNFRDGKMYFEYQGNHHHYVTCTSCGDNEEIKYCIKSMIPKILDDSRSFDTITNHALEFFGICKKCT